MRDDEVNQRADVSDESIGFFVVGFAGKPVLAAAAATGRQNG